MKGPVLTINILFLRKLLVAFIVGFAGSVLEMIVDVGPVADLSAWKAVWVSAVTGAVVVGFRAVLVLLPGVNLVPSDSQSPVAKTPPAKKPAAKPAAKTPAAK